MIRAEMQSGPYSQSGVAEEDRVGTNIQTVTTAIDEAISALRAEIQRHEKEIARSEAELEKLERARRTIAISPDENEFNTEACPPDGFGERKRTRKSSAAWRVRKAAWLALKKANRPMARTEILEAIERMGTIVPGIDPGKTVGRILWNAPEFEHVSTGYWIKGDALPQIESLPKKRHRRMKKS